MDKSTAVERLREMLKPGDTVQTILRHVSRSGMTRAISPIFNGEDISYLVAPATDRTLDRNHGGIKIGGCGSDMGFELVYDLSRVLFQDRFICSGEGCSSNDHFNGDRNYAPHPHSDGGYALRQRWL